MDVNQITALEFLEAEQKAARNGIDKPPFRRLLSELQNLPKAQQRLAFEFLAMAWRALNSAGDPGQLIAWSTFYAKAIEQQKLQEYLFWLEKIILRCFERLKDLQIPFDGSCPYSLVLWSALPFLHRTHPDKFRVVLDALKRQCGEEDGDLRWRLVERISGRQ